jgi:hypothetical protein
VKLIVTQLVKKYASHSASQEICHCLWNPKVQESGTETSPKPDESSPYPLKCSIKAGSFFDQSETMKFSGKTVKIMLVDRLAV